MLYIPSNLPSNKTEHKTLKVLEDLKCKTFMKYALSSGMFPVLDSLVMVYTIFAPSDEAFEQLDEKVKSRLDSDHAYLRQVFQHSMML